MIGYVIPIRFVTYVTFNATWTVVSIHGGIVAKSKIGN